MWWLLLALPVAGYVGLRYLESQVTDKDYSWVYPILAISLAIGVAALILR